MAEATVKVTSDEFLSKHLVILKGNRRDGKGEYACLTVDKKAMWDSSVQAIADMFGVKTIDLRKPAK